jgi:hypothetical protein
MPKPDHKADPTQWGTEAPFDETVTPIVFHFRPHSIAAISPDKRAEFEKYFEENVGFPPPKVKSGAKLRSQYPNGGISGSNGGWDDCIP